MKTIVGTQGQTVENNSVAVQAGGDAHVHIVGVPPEQVKELLHETLQAAMPIAQLAAETIMRERMTELEEKLCTRLTDQFQPALDALATPDFQLLLRGAGRDYARSGDEQVGENLVELISRRAGEASRDRLTLSLNQAVEKVPLLTPNEFAELSLVFLFKLSRGPSVNSRQTLCDYISNKWMPFVDSVSKEEGSYTYLEAQSCAQIIPFSQTLFRDIINSTYGGLLSKGFDPAEFNEILPNGRAIWEDSAVIIPCINNAAKFQLNALERQTFDGNIAPRMSKDEAERLWQMFTNTMWSKEELIESLSKDVDRFETLVQAWDESLLKTIRLTPAGVAIGHANAKLTVGFDADLREWIR